jgi:hypothetical protein
MAARPPVVSFAQLAAGTLAFSVALSWNEAVGYFVRRLGGGGGEPARVLLSALVVTLLVVAAAHALNAAGARFGWASPGRGPECGGPECGGPGCGGPGCGGPGGRPPAA